MSLARIRSTNVTILIGSEQLQPTEIQSLVRERGLEHWKSSWQNKKNV